MIGTTTQKISTRKSRVGNPLKYALRWLVAADAAHRERAKLATMTDDQLSDIGLSRSDAQRLSGKTDWDAPIQFY